MKHQKLILLALMLAGCSTTAKYEPRLPAGPAKPADYPIYIYVEGVQVPRAFEVIGTMRVSPTSFTVMGGSLEKVLAKLRDHARAKGAEAVQLTDVTKPDFWNPNYGAEAAFLRFTDVWESIALTPEDVRAYFQTNQARLEPAEGVWMGNDATRSRVAIMKNASQRGRDLVAWMLDSRNPSWCAGDKKMDLVRGERPGIYRGTYYQDDYRGKRVAFTLRGAATNQIFLQLSEAGEFVLFSRETPVSGE